MRLQNNVIAQDSMKSRISWIMTIIASRVSSYKRPMVFSKLESYHITLRQVLLSGIKEKINEDTICLLKRL